MKTVNCYVIKGQEVVLIDSGENTDESFDALATGLGNHNLEVADIDRIILTHAHVDHMGMAERVASVANATVHVSELVYDWAVKPEEMWSQREALMLPSLMDYFNEDTRSLITMGYTEMMGNVKKVWQPIREDRLALFDSEGSIMIDGETWEVLYMPGHSLTQSTFYHRSSKSYLSADMLLRITPTPVIEPSLTEPGKREKGILMMMASYERLLGIGIDAVYPGHYEVFHNAHDVINNQVDRINQRAAQTLDLIKNGHDTFLDIFNLLYAGRFHMPALIMLIGYLDLLEDRGLIKRERQDDMIKITAIAS